MSASEVSSILQEWFTRSGRCLQAPQQSIVDDMLSQSPLPLYIKLTYNEAYRWKSYTHVNQDILGDTVKEAIDFLFERVEKYHGEILVTRALAYITAAKQGLR